MKRHLTILLLAFLLGLVIFFQMSQSPQHILIPWRTMFAMQCHGTRLLGSFTLQQQWNMTWRCTSSTTILTIQIDTYQGNSLQETAPCDGNAHSEPIHESGTFYLAATTEGEWMLQIQESPVEYKVVTPWSCCTRHGVHMAEIGRVCST